MKKNNLIFSLQGVYYLLTGIWPLVHIRSFIYVTGPKTDIWLVEMVSLLAISIGITLLTTMKNKTRPLVLSSTAALSFLTIDVYYVLNGRISAVYLADAAVEIIFLMLLLFSSFHSSFNR
jgi:hypothetical protein